MKSFSKSVAVLASLALAQNYDDFEVLGAETIEEIANLLGNYASYISGIDLSDYGTNYEGQVESSAEDAPVTAEDLLNVDYNVDETDDVIGEYEEGIDGQERRPLANLATFEEKINLAKPNNNYCKTCSGVSYDDCEANGTMEPCNDAQDVCEVKYRFNYAGEATFWSGCKQRQACLNDEQGNFVGGRFFLNRCKSTKVPARWLAGSECTFCSLMSESAATNIFGPSSNIVQALGTITTGLSLPLSLTNLFEDPEAYLDAGKTNYIFGSQTYA